MKFNLGLFAVLLFGLSSQSANASLILELSGTTGSNVMTYKASGSVTVSNATSGLSSSIALAPVGGSWSGSFDNNLGNFLRNSMDGTFNDNLALSNGGVSYRKNGTEFGVLDLLDLDGSSTSGGDDVELDFSGNIDYPDLNDGDVVSWTGSGTFLLEDGETFDSLFTSTGTFSNNIDGGTYDVVISGSSTGPVPEPGSLLIFAGLASSCFFARQRRNKKS